MEPILFLNFKTYKEGTGSNSVKLAKIAEKAAEETGSKIILVVQAIDLHNVVASTGLPVFAQHIDPVQFGSNTGKILPEAVKAAGAEGTITNHAEDKQSNEFIEGCIKRAKEAGLKIMVCAENVDRAEQIASMAEKPDFIAIEPPELIGGNVSVSAAKPEAISGAVEAIHKIAPIPVITGAGIKTTEDVKKAIELGTVGVFVASGIIKATDQEKAIRDLVAGFV